MNFMIIRRFFCILLIFGLIFAFFDDYFVLLAQLGIEETPSTLTTL